MTSIDDVYEVEEVGRDAFDLLNKIGSSQNAIIIEPESGYSTIDSENRLNSESLTKMMDDSIGKLSDSLGVDKPIVNAVDILEEIDKANALNKKTFDLLSSKLISNVHMRTRAKAMLAANIQLDKLSLMMTSLDSCDYENDPMSYLLLIEKFTEYVGKTDSLVERYNDPAIEESLTELTKETVRASEPTSKELTSDEIHELMLSYKRLKNRESELAELDNLKAELELYRSGAKK